MREILRKIFGDKWFGPGGTFGSYVSEIDHPIFGKLIFSQGANGPYWIHETYENSSKEEVCVSIDTVGTEPPSKKQKEFYSNVIEQLDEYFQKASDLIVPEYESYLSETFPLRWKDAFRLASLNVPLEGDEMRKWDITFECKTKNSGFLFTCYFENGKPLYVGVDT
ncbi:MAG: hypothetical protein ACRBHB_02310 [Arenicella sp.]